MKKILFATTALVATAGVAAADVSFGGYARFGVEYDSSRTSEEVRIESRFRLIVTATAESDNGLSFGAQVRYQANEDSQSAGGGTGALDNSDAGFNLPRFFVSTGGLTVSVGNVMGAIENMPGLYAGGVGLTGLGDNNVVAHGRDMYSSGSSGRFGVDVIYSVGAFGVHLSHSFDDTYLDDTNGSEARTALAVSYSMGDYTFAAAAQDSDVDTGDAEVVLTASGVFGPMTATLQFADNGTDEQAYGVGLNYTLSAATALSGYLMHDDSLDGGDGDENFGIGFNHNMGGGTSLRGGVARVDGDTIADLGLLFNF